MKIQITLTHTGAIALGLVGHGVYSLVAGHAVRGVVEIWIGARIARTGGPLVSVIRSR